jgi:ABC-type bacteriocin/lantibiotic exporter with double-glycine peptidase domain
MSSKPPFIAQERPDTCTLACLRMVLASQGIHVSEPTLLEQVSLVEGGANPDQLVALARAQGLSAKATQSDLETIRELVTEEKFPIVFVDRSLLDAEFTIHAVIPIRFSAQYVTVLDPLRGERKLSIRKFGQAQRRVGWMVVCEGA